MLEDLRARVEFAHAGSIAGTADRLFRTPSAITRQVQRLNGWRLHWVLSCSTAGVLGVRWVYRTDFEAGCAACCMRLCPWPPSISLFSNDLQSGCAVEVLVH
jgi:Bacterial regulatory helix-turn-helix protein, lysR family